MYESVKKAAMVAVYFALTATAVWFVAVPVVEAWHNAWLAQPTFGIPFWKRLLISFARGWPIAWPALVVFVWIMSFLPIELVRRIKARRS
jgi:hypothetical protein